MRPILVISLAALPTFLSGIEQSVMSTSAATIAGQMGAETTLAWILAAFFIAASVATPVYGRLGDHFGPIRVLICAILIFAAGSLLATQAQNFHILVLARFIQGIGGGGLISLPQAFLSQTIPPRERAAYQGYLVAVAFTANTFGPALGGFLIGGFGWQAIFWLEVPLALIAATFLILAPKQALRESAGLKLRFDWMGALSLMVAISSLMMLTQTLTKAGPAHTAILWAAVFTLSSIAFIAVERRVSDPLLPLALLRGPIVWKCGLIVFLYGFLFTGLSSYIPVLLNRQFELSPEKIGVMMMLPLGAVGVGSIITGQLVRKSGRTMIFPAFGLTTVATILLGFVLAMTHLSPWQTAIWVGLNGLFMGSTLGVVQVALQLGSPAHMIGRATAFIQLSRTIGASLGAGVGGLIYFRLQHGLEATASASPSASSDFSALPFIVLFCFFAAVALTAALIASRCRVPRLS